MESEKQGSNLYKKQLDEDNFIVWVEMNNVVAGSTMIKLYKSQSKGAYCKLFMRLSIAEK